MEIPEEDLFDVKTRDAALRWHGIDELVRDIREFKPHRRLTGEEKKTLLSFAERASCFMPPSINQRRKYAYDEALSALAAPDALERNIVSMVERWSIKTHEMCDRVAPLPPIFDAQLLRGKYSKPDVSKMHEASGAIVHLVHSCEPHLAAIQQQLPSFYEALVPLRCSVKLKEVRGAARRYNDGKLDGLKYADIVNSFLSDERNAALLSDQELKVRISKSLTHDTDKQLLVGDPIVLKVAMQIQLPSTQNCYTDYLKLLTNALSQDVVRKYPLPKDPAKPDENARGDSSRIVFDNPEAPWLENMYAFRWARVAREVAKQMYTHKTEFRGGKVKAPVVDFAGALHESREKKSGQMGLF